jgi:hypothetical protein
MLRDLSLEARVQAINDRLNTLCVNHRVISDSITDQSPINHIIYFCRPRVYRDKKRVFHDIFNYQWNRFCDTVGAFAAVGSSYSDLRTSRRISSYLREQSMRRSTLVSDQNAEYS